MVWLLLLMTLVGAGVWHVRENREMAARWQSLDEKAAQELNRFAWSRTFQLLGALACFLLVLIVYEWQLSSARSSVEELSDIRTKLEAQLAKQAVAPAPAQMAAQPVEDVPHGRPIAVPPGGIGFAPPPQQTVPKPTVADLYNPEEKNRDNPSEIDALKKRYENILVTYMFLKRCNKVGDGDYPVIISALGQEMASINAPGRLQSDIINSAQGSYNEIYSHSSCTDASIDTLVQQYSAYVKAIAGHLPAVQP